MAALSYFRACLYDSFTVESMHVPSDFVSTTLNFGHLIYVQLSSLQHVNMVKGSVTLGA